MPPLPNPVYHIVSQGELVGYMSAEQIKAYGQQCRAAALEEAALICESENEGWHSDANAAAAQKIRRLK